MTVVEIGQILALVGMVLLLAGGLGRQRARKQGKLRDPAFQKQQRWLQFAAFGLILAGLVLMWARR